MSAIYTKDSIGGGQTYCNIAGYDLMDSRCKAVWWNKVRVGNSIAINLPMGNVIKAYDYDLGKILREDSYDKILTAPIPFVFDEAIRESGIGGVKLLTQQQAQEYANQGVPSLIISKEFRHVAIACPHLRWSDNKGRMELYPYDPVKGCFTGNAGATNDFMYMSDRRGFGYYDWQSKEHIIYVLLKDYITQEFPVLKV
jgi:hypothetical protein